MIVQYIGCVRTVFRHVDGPTRSCTLSCQLHGRYIANAHLSSFVVPFSQQCAVSALLRSHRCHDSDRRFQLPTSRPRHPEPPARLHPLQCSTTIPPANRRISAPTRPDPFPFQVSTPRLCHLHTAHRTPPSATASTPLFPSVRPFHPLHSSTIPIHN